MLVQLRSLTILKKQFDNKFLVGGTTRIDDRKKNDASFVSRFTPEGVIDQSFGANGTVITEYGDAGDNTVDLFVQSDQKIVGLFRIRSNSFAIERFLPIGQLDLNFGLDEKKRLLKLMIILLVNILLLQNLTNSLLLLVVKKW